MCQPGNPTAPSPSEQYRALWSQGVVPDLTRFLDEHSPLTTRELAAVLRIDQAQRWSLHLQPTCENYFQRFPFVEQDSDAAIDLIYAEYLLRRKFGPPPTMAEFLARFPDQVASLEPQLQLDQLVDPLTAESSPAVGSCSLQSTNPNREEPLLSTTRQHEPSRHIGFGGGVTRGHQVGQYRLLRELGQGGMGTVWEAESSVNGRRVAIKLISCATRCDDLAAVMFAREAQLAASISHPRSAFVLEAGWQDNRPYLVMELMPGHTLRSLVAAGPIPASQAIDHILDVLDGLAAAHARGVLHRDIKPANCFVDAEGRAKIGDYGLAVTLLDATAKEHFAGTVAFASPEQLRTASLDERSDQYSLGATLYFLLARRPPFVGGTTAVISQVAADPPPRLSGLVADLPAGLERVIAKSLAKSPDQRYANLAQFRQALLPFSSRGTFLANVGRRLAAFALDDSLLVFGSFGLLVAMLIVVLVMGRDLSNTRAILESSFAQGAISATLFSLLGVGYYATAEGWTGAGLGKRLLGLRVVGPDGGRPGFARATLRAFFVPLACGWTMLDPFLLPRAEFSQDSLRGFDLQQLMFVPMLLGTISYIPIVLILLPIILKRSALGWHDRASGTRVIQLVEFTPENHDPAPPVSPDLCASLTFGPFRIVRQQWTTSDYTVYEGYDEVLRRRARIIVHSHPLAPESPSSTVARSTRNRWLQSGANWEAYELPPGAPLISHGRMDACDWESARRMLLDLAEELAASRKERSLPQSLGLGQLYRTTSNRLIFCDIPVSPPGESPTFEGPERDWGFFRYVVKSSGVGSEWPSHARDFVAAISGSEDGIGGIDPAVARLKDMLHRPATFRWDDRLGVMSLAITAQAWILTFLVVLWVVTVTRWISFDSTSRFVFAAAAIVLPGLGPLLIGRGPLMRFLQITLQTREGKPANRLQISCRNILAWLPWSASWVLFGWSMAALSHTLSTESPAPNDALGLMDAPFVLLTLLAAFLPLASLLPVGLFALWHPARGLAERLTNTQLAYE